MTPSLISSDTAEPRLQLLRNESFWLLCLSILIALLMLRAPNFTSATDSLGSLLTSQAILQHGTVKLDPYAETIRREPTPYNYQLITHAGHLYCFYPIGTPLCVLPAVAAAQILGLDMSNDRHDRWLQRLLSAFTVVVAFVLIYVLIRAWLQPVASMLLAVAMTAGSSIFSTMGSALWGFDFEVIFQLLCLIILVRGDITHSRWQAYVLGLLLFLAYLCRPTAVVFIVTSSAYLFWVSRRGFVKACVIMSILSIAFIIFSWLEYQQVLPPYYLPQKMLDPTSFWKGLYGSLLSPSRGLLIFSPQILVILLGTAIFWRPLVKNPLIASIAACAVLHILMIARWKDWWAGFSFGPRYFTDAMPVLVVLAAWLFKQLHEVSAKRLRTTLTVSFAVASAWAIFLNTWQGLYNRHTNEWNAHPNISQHPDVVFDWRSPQFLATAKSNKERVERYRIEQGFLD